MKLFTAFFILSAFLAGQALAQAEAPENTAVTLVEEAYLAHREGDFEAAVRKYDNIIQRRGLAGRELGVIYLLRGEAKRDACDLNEAALDFTRALGQWPDYPQAYFFRGRVYERQGNLTGAYADISRASELDPSRKSYLAALSALRKKMRANGLVIPLAENLPQPAGPALPLDDL